MDIKGRNKDNEWINEDLLSSYVEESKNDPTRNYTLNEGESNQRYYSAVSEWWVSHGGIDVDISTREDSVPTSCENYVRQIVNDLISLLFKNDPEARFHPQFGHPEDSDLTDTMDSMVRMVWKNASIKPAIITWGQQACIRGLSTIKVIWNSNDQSRSKFGDIGVVNIRPEDIFYDPNATNSNRALDCRYIVHRLWKSKEFIARRFGESGLEAANISPKTWVGASFDKIAKAVTRHKDRKINEDDKVEVLEFWLFPTTKFDNDVTGSDISENEYKYGAVAYMVDSKIVEIMRNPYFKVVNKQELSLNGQSSLKQNIVIGHHRHPFVPLWWIRTAGVDGHNGIYNCLGAVSSMKMPQTSLYKLLQDTEINIGTSANPPFGYIEGALENPPDSIMRRPGEGIAVSAAYQGEGIDHAIRFWNGQQLPPDVWNLINRKTMAIKELGGIQPGMTGAYPQGTSHTPAMTIAAMQEASFSPMWAITKEIDEGLKDVAELVMGLIQQYYEKGRYVDVESNGFEHSIVLSEKHLQTSFQCVIVSGTTTPMYDVERETKMMNINAKVDQAISMSFQMQDPIFMETCAIYLESIKYPPSFQYIQLLRKKIGELQQQIQQAQEMQMQAGLLSLAGQVGEQEQQQQPLDSEEAIAQFEEGELGVPRGTLDSKLSVQ